MDVKNGLITVKFFGGAKKSFSKDIIQIEDDNLTINQLLAHLVKLKPEENPELDLNNLLIAVNEIDSSALDGMNTKLQPDDVISIIPVIHGGSSKKIEFKISGYSVQISKVKGKNLDQSFLDSLRIKFPKLSIQGIAAKFILSESHASKIITLSTNAKKGNTMLSKKLETDILLRFAGTKQILDAINKAGIKPSCNFFVIALGPKPSLKKLALELMPVLSNVTFSKQNPEFLKKEFKITKKQTDSIHSSSPLEDLLCEKAAILFG